MEDLELLYEYHDKNGVTIRIEKTNIVNRGGFIMVEVSIRKNILIGIIDYCIPECLLWWGKTFYELRKNKKFRVARRWLWKRTKDMDFGDTGYKFKDFFKDGEIDFKTARNKYDNYCYERECIRKKNNINKK